MIRYNEKLEKENSAEEPAPMVLEPKAIPIEPPCGGRTGEAEDIRSFESGATRDTSKGKLSYVKGLSAKVLHRYMQYLQKHRLQANGQMREFDNWKKGIPQEVYLDSLVRHTMDLVRLSEGAEVGDNHGPVTEEDLLCAIMFNAQGKLFEILKEKGSEK
jgi:hypothetical protein